MNCSYICFFWKTEWLEKPSRLRSKGVLEYFTLIAGGWMVEIKPLRKQSSNTHTYCFCKDPQFQSRLSSGGWFFPPLFAVELLIYIIYMYILKNKKIYRNMYHIHIYVIIAMFITNCLVAHLVLISISACFQENSRPYVPPMEVLHRWPKKTHFCLPSCTLVHATWNAKSLHNGISFCPLRPYFWGGVHRWG